MEIPTAGVDILARTRPSWICIRPPASAFRTKPAQQLRRNAWFDSIPPPTRTSEHSSKGELFHAWSAQTYAPIPEIQSHDTDSEEEEVQGEDWRTRYTPLKKHELKLSYVPPDPMAWEDALTFKERKYLKKLRVHSPEPAIASRKVQWSSPSATMRDLQEGQQARALFQTEAFQHAFKIHRKQCNANEARQRPHISRPPVPRLKAGSAGGGQPTQNSTTLSQMALQMRLHLIAKGKNSAQA